MVRAVQLYAWFSPGKQQVILLSAICSIVYNVQVVGKALLVSGEMSSLFQLLSSSLRKPWVRRFQVNKLPVATVVRADQFAMQMGLEVL